MGEPEYTTPGVSPSGRIRLTDQGNAVRICRVVGKDLHFCSGLGWLIWDSQRFRQDKGLEAEQKVKHALATLYNEVKAAEDRYARLELEATEDGNGELARDLKKKRTAATKTIKSWANKSGSYSSLTAATKLARTEPGIGVSADELDANPWLLNLQNGTLNLQSSEFHPHDRKDRITKLAPVNYDPHAKAPRWLRFLNEVFCEDAEIIAYVQRVVGYMLTADVSEQVFFYFLGNGANGKTTFVNTIDAIMGDYCIQAEADLLLEKSTSTHSTGLTDLVGRRMASCSEVDNGKSLAEALTKRLTGGDTITARRMRQDNISFEPTHKIVISANSMLKVSGTDNGIWRRIRIVPFNASFLDGAADKNLSRDLKREYSGILAWAVRGCLEWQKRGLGQPASVLERELYYRREQDIIGRFLREECCEDEDEATVSKSELYATYRAWCEQAGEAPDTKKGFGHKLMQRGIADRRMRHTRLWVGLRLGTSSQRLSNRDPERDTSGDPDPEMN